MQSLASQTTEIALEAYRVTCIQGADPSLPTIGNVSLNGHSGRLDCDGGTVGVASHGIATAREFTESEGPAALRTWHGFQCCPHRADRTADRATPRLLLKRIAERQRQTEVVVMSNVILLALTLGAAGGLSGFLAGVFGVGGGTVVVPVLYGVFVMLGVPDELRMPLSAGTSLALSSRRLSHHSLATAKRMQSISICLDCGVFRSSPA